MEVIKAPSNFAHILGEPAIFLAGSIDNGQAVDWQKEATELALEAGFHVLNPRRDDWDWSWEQSIENPKFFEQVSWELSALEAVEGVLIYFAPGSKSPISLLEFGLFYHKMVVVCPDGFWRKGNVDIVCDRYNVPQAKTIKEAIACLKQFATFANPSLAGK